MKAPLPGEAAIETARSVGRLTRRLSDLEDDRSRAETQRGILTAHGTPAIAPRSTRSAWLTLGLAVMVSVAGVWLVARGVDPARLGRVLSTADYGWVLIGVVAIGVTFFARAYRWAVLLHPIRYRGSTLMAALLIGQTLNFLLPLRAGDVVRSVALGRAPGSSVERVLGSVAIEKVWDWTALTALVLIVAR